jgi:hypothetical protein
MINNYDQEIEKMYHPENFEMEDRNIGELEDQRDELLLDDLGE